MTRHFSLRATAPLFLLSIVLPFSVFAATPVSDALRTPDATTVTRGDFLRASIQVLGIEHGDRTRLSDKRVPASLVPYVNAAMKRKALEPFGAELNLSKEITRGEAVTLLVLLQDLHAQTTITFRDVPAGSTLENAVKVAISKAWIDPVRRNQFGVTRTMNGKEARLLLRKATSPESIFEDEDDTTQTIIVPIRAPTATQLPKEDLLKTVWKMLVDQYITQDKLDPEEAAFAAAEAIVNSVKDPYTTFMRPANSREFQTQLGGEVSGIGVQVELKEGKLLVVTPLEGSPASKAGIKTGDQIIAADGVSLEGVNLLDAVGRIRGPSGTPVKLTIRRDTTEFDVTVVRAVITVPEISVTTQGTVSIVRLLQFGQTSQRDIRTIMEEVQSKNPTGIIIDLRNNPGGLLDAADAVLSNFLPEGSTVASIATRDGTYKEETIGKPTVKDDVRVIVLINEGSASASEIVAGALQDAKRARVVGAKSYGKGTVQQIVEFTDGSSLKMTIAEWRTPGGRKIDGVGVTPDVIVESSDGARDEQLLKALELLR